jgi:hypothetical protein
VKTENAISAPQTNATPQPDKDGLILDVMLAGARVGTLHCINLARPSEPQRLGWFGKNAAGTATGAAWPTREEAAYDVLAWADGKPGREKEVMYLPPLAAGTVATCTATMVFRRRADNKVHCRLFKWHGQTPAEALRKLIEQAGTEGRQVRVTVEVLPIAAHVEPNAPSVDTGQVNPWVTVTSPLRDPSCLPEQNEKVLVELRRGGRTVGSLTWAYRCWQRIKAATNEN